MSNTTNLRSSLIRLASAHPEFRSQILPILTASTDKTASTYAEYEKRKKSEGGKPMAEKAWESRVKHHKQMADYHKKLARDSTDSDVIEDHGVARKAHEKAALDPEKKDPNNGFSASHQADRASNRAMATHHLTRADEISHNHRGNPADSIAMIHRHEDAAKAHHGVSRGESMGADGGKFLSDIEKDSKAAWEATAKAHGVGR